MKIFVYPRWVASLMILSAFAAAGAVLYYTARISYASVAPLFEIREVDVRCIDTYSPVINEDISDWLEAALKDGKLALHGRYAVAQELLEEFPLIDRVSWHMYKPGHLTCIMYGSQPKYVVNDRIIATANGRLFDPKLFASFSKELPHLYINEEWMTPKVFPGVFTFLQNQPDLLYCVYSLHYQEPGTIFLFPEQTDILPDPAICIIDEDNASRIVSPVRLAQLAEDIKQRKSEEWRNGSAFLFDFRFDRRIIGKVISMDEYTALRSEHRD